MGRWENPNRRPSKECLKKKKKDKEAILLRAAFLGIVDFLNFFN